MYEFKTKLLYNSEKLFCAKGELLSFNIILPLAKLDIVGSRLVSTGLIFSDDISVSYPISWKNVYGKFFMENFLFLMEFSVKFDL